MTQNSTWSALPRDQAQFFRAQLTAASETVFSPAAHQAGIVPVVAEQYSIKAPDDSYEPWRLIAWPDPHDVGAICVLASQLSDSRSVFAQVKEHPNGHQAEGVGVNMIDDKSTDFYGMHVIPGDSKKLAPVESGIGFIKELFAQAKAQKEGGSDSLLVGIEGGVASNLFRALSSLAANITIQGSMYEQANFASQAYAMAGVLLRCALIAAYESGVDNPGGRDLERGVLLGPQMVMFENEEGIHVVRHQLGFPDAITMFVVPRPKVDEPLIIASKYTVLPKTVFYDFMTLDPESYHPEVLAAMVNRPAIVLNGEMPSEPITYSPQNVRELEGRIARLIAGRQR